MSASEELELLKKEAATLPDRHFWLWNRRVRYPAQLVRTLDVVPRGSGFRSAERARVLRDGTVAVPIEELAAHGSKAKPAEPTQLTLLRPTRRRWGAR